MRKGELPGIPKRSTSATPCEPYQTFLTYIFIYLFLLGSAPELVSSEDKPAATESGSSVEPDEKDIKLVMDQANVEREKAVKAIKEADGDLINASEFCGINC